MSGGGGLSKIGIALTVIFVISLLALFAQCFYVLWRRRVFRRQLNSGVDGGRIDHLSIYSSSDSSFSSKELLYFFCIRSDSRLDSNSITGATSNDHDPNSNRHLDMEVVDIDVLKLQGAFGPPRFLFTIKEGEREGLESPADKSMHSADKAAKKILEGNRDNRVSLEECFKEAAGEVVVKMEVDVVNGHETTPFSTPCASPVYFTPSASPVHEVIHGEVLDEVRINQ